ncbi:MAG: hypothetical protein AAF915_23245 [Cyanobacteria bacterium P01_D01_bin.50]
MEENEASEVLIVLQLFNDFITNSKKIFSRKAIEEFARSQSRHPGIILGHLQYEKLVPYKNLRALLVKVSPLLQNWIDT